uniref:PDZ domain-containing protein n=1 Tax=Kryptolebias marmoratus TaxID=37003 RepID=A0A3Q3ERR9_KRYMA
YQRLDTARLTSVVAPRPFGSQSSRITSLPRAYTVDDANKHVNGNVDVSKKTSVPSRYHQFMTSEDEAQSSSAHSSEEEEEEERTKENFCEMRISLNQKPNSNRDFGFHAAWDSTGARVTSIQPSPAEMCQLQVGDEVLTVNGHQVAEMSYSEWRSCLGTALQDGSLVMDVRRHGQNSAETKTIKSSLDFTSNRVNGDLQEEPVTLRNKSEPISLKNLKRRSEFFE